MRQARFIWSARLRRYCEKGNGFNMIDFEEELKKFHPSLEVDEAEEAIYNQDLTDMADIVVGMVKDIKEEE